MDNDFSLKTIEVVQQFEYLPDALRSADALAAVCAGLTNIKTWCLCVHDKDVYTDADQRFNPAHVAGSLKAIHFHAVLTFSKTTMASVVAHAFGCDSTSILQKIKGTTRSAQLYLCHHNQPQKYQYDPCCVLANFDYPSLVMSIVSNETIDDFINRVACGDIREYNYADYISPVLYARNINRIRAAFKYRSDRLASVGGDRDMRVIYVYGVAGAGKTTFAKDFARKNNYSFYVSSGGKNALDDYKGQDCIILDDLRDSTFAFADLLKLLDNHTDSAVPCRYFNKNIGECKLIIITSIMSPEDLYKGVCASVGSDRVEPRAQLYRRFSGGVLKVTPDTVYVYSCVVDSSGSPTDTLECVASMPNMCKFQFAANKQSVLNYIGGVMSAAGVSLKTFDTDSPTPSDEWVGAAHNPFLDDSAN